MTLIQAIFCNHTIYFIRSRWWGSGSAEWTRGLRGSAEWTRGLRGSAEWTRGLRGSAEWTRGLRESAEWTGVVTARSEPLHPLAYLLQTGMASRYW